MDDDRTTRRTAIRTGAGALLAGLAGCLGGEADEGSPTTDPTSTPPGETTTPTDSAESSPTDEPAADSDDPRSVTMAPAGTVSFDSIPDRWLSYFPGYADMGVALGMGDGLQAVGLPSRYHTDHYAELDGVEMDVASLTQLYAEGVDAEIYYELDCDVHLTDPEWLVNNSALGLSAADVAAIEESVAPFIGNTIFRRTDSWHDYRYYTLYEAFAIVAEIFDERERYAAIRDLHDEVVATVQAALPPIDDRPNAMLIWATGEAPEEFYPYRLSDRGTNKKQFHDLGIDDALAGTGIDGLSTTSRGSIDYETILSVDPDVLFVRGYESLSAAEFGETVREPMRDHDVAQSLSAVQSGRVFRGGPIYQGPIHHLFTLERAATDLFPETFDGELFDRNRLAGIITGES